MMPSKCSMQPNELTIGALFFLSLWFHIQIGAELGEYANDVAEPDVAALVGAEDHAGGADNAGQNDGCNERHRHVCRADDHHDYDDAYHAASCRGVHTDLCKDIDHEEGYNAPEVTQ